MLARYHKICPYLAGLTPLEAFQVCLPLVALDDIAAYDLRAEAVAQTGARILQLLAVVAADRQYPMHGIAQTVQRGWVPHDERATGLLTATTDRKSTRLNSSHQIISYAVFCLKKKNQSLYPVT